VRHERVPQVVEVEVREAGGADDSVEEPPDLVGPDRGARRGLRAAAFSLVQALGQELKVGDQRVLSDRIPGESLSRAPVTTGYGWG